MSHTPPAYLRKPITLRLHCRKCDTKRLHSCQAVGTFSMTHQQVETICLHCGKWVTK